MCFSASSSKTSPVGVSDLQITFRFGRLRRRMPAFSSSRRFRSDSSTSMHPLRADDMESFQNEVYPFKINKHQNVR
jgi:hypothetical protein